MEKAINIARFFLELFKYDEDGITNLKLNKLLYYAQGCHYQRIGKPLFGEPIEAWQLGPVVRSVYNTYKPCGRNPITPPEEDTKLDAQTEDFLIDVAREYGKYTGSTLVTMTHKKNTPWYNVFEEGKNNIITNEAIKEYFTTIEKPLPTATIEFTDNDFIGYRDEEDYLVLPKEYNDEIQ